LRRISKQRIAGDDRKSASPPWVAEVSIASPEPPRAAGRRSHPVPDYRRPHRSASRIARGQPCTAKREWEDSRQRELASARKTKGDAANAAAAIERCPRRSKRKHAGHRIAKRQQACHRKLQRRSETAALNGHCDGRKARRRIRGQRRAAGVRAGSNTETRRCAPLATRASSDR